MTTIYPKTIPPEKVDIEMQRRGTAPASSQGMTSAQARGLSDQRPSTTSITKLDADRSKPFDEERGRGCLDLEPLAVTVKTGARISGLGATMLYALISDGTLESFKIGNRRLIVYSSLKRLCGPRKEQGPDMRSASSKKSIVGYAP